MIAGALPLGYVVLITALNAGCPAVFARLEAWLFIALAAACAIAILYVGLHAAAPAITLVQVASGTVVGMFLQPSTSGLVALVTSVLSLLALRRGRSFLGGLALFALGIAAGIGALILTSATPARC